MKFLLFKLQQQQVYTANTSSSLHATFHLSCSGADPNVSREMMAIKQIATRNKFNPSTICIS